VEKLLMARFDVYANPGSKSDTTPYLLDVPSNLLDDLKSRMVIPLRSRKHFPKVKLSPHLTPVFTIKGHDYLLETPKMGAVPVRTLKKARKLTGNSAGTDNSGAGFPVSLLLNIHPDFIRRRVWIPYSLSSE
jgi:toxin CcdB